MNARNWLRSFDFLIQSKTARKRLLLFRCQPSENKWLFPILYCVISYTIISYTLLYVREKTSLKRNLKKKQSQNTKQVEYCELIQERSFGGERLIFFHKKGDYSRSRGDGKNWTKMGRFPRQMQKVGRFYKLVRCEVSRLTMVWSIYFRLSFSYAILTSYLEIILFRT